MELRTMLSEDRVRELVADVSRDSYAGNVIIDYIDIRRTRRDGRNTMILKLRVASSKGEGARRSGSGRRTVSACWHAHRDIMRAVYALDRDATFLTAVARYDGAGNFEGTFPFTYSHNVGSISQSGAIGSLCECYHPRLVVTEQRYGRV